MCNLIVVLGDQLTRDSAALDDYDPSVDVVWMAEAANEANYVPSHKKRLVAFFSAMRHFRDDLRNAGFRIDYHALSKDENQDRSGSLSEILTIDIKKYAPQKIVVSRPGDYRVLVDLRECCDTAGIEIEVREDRHFMCSTDEFEAWSRERKRLTLEDFYRWMRKRHDVLMKGGAPVGDHWNFDKKNRHAFGSCGPAEIAPPASFPPDKTTLDVISLVESRFINHPGQIGDFLLPTTREQSLDLLEDFVRNRLANFGRYQDAMWTQQPFLSHSLLSFSLNTHMLTPEECVTAAVRAHEEREAPIESVEGFVRQILGWREFVRAIYWREMPEYGALNSLECEDIDVPTAYWTGETEMACVRDAMRSVVEHGYAHHIQRLMVLGLYAQLLGVHPSRFHDWHMAMYVDAVDWVSLPNTLGMSQFADGGLIGTKPYCASGNYINRMSNYCGRCRFDYKSSVGENACPMTAMYWEFLDRHRDRFSGNHRMNFQMRNLEKLGPETLAEVKLTAERIRSQSLRT